MIEAIRFNDQIESYLIFYGKITGITNFQEVSFLKSYISNDYPNDFFEKNEILQTIIRKIGIKNVCKLINYCDETLPLPNESFFDKFLSYAKNFNYLNNEETTNITKEIYSYRKKHGMKSIIKEINLDIDPSLKTQEILEIRRNLPLISGEKTLNLSECENIESIMGSIPQFKGNSYFESGSLNSPPLHNNIMNSEQNGKLNSFDQSAGTWYNNQMSEISSKESNK